METRRGMSPWSAFFMGMWLTGSVAIAAGTVVVLCGMNVVDSKLSDVLMLGSDVVGNVPKLMEAVKPALGDAFNDVRSPEYGSKVEVTVHSPSQDKYCGRPALTVRNTGNEVVSRLTVRVSAVDESGATRYEWTEMAATPVALCNELRGPLMPGNQIRRMVFSDGPCIRGDELAGLSLKHEIAEIFVWTGSARSPSVTSLTAD